MKYTFTILLFYFSTLIYGQNIFELTNSSYFKLKDLKIKEGDNPGWKNNEFDDSSWEFLNNYSASNMDGRWWIRAEVNIDQMPTQHKLVTIHCMRFFSAYQVYWDGNKIGENGHYGTSKQEEEAGIFRYPLTLNENELSVGKHILAIRLSNFHTKSNISAAKILFGDFFEWTKKLGSYFVIFYGVIAILLFTLLMNLFLLFFTQDKLVSLLLVLLSFFTLVNQVFINLWLVVDLPTTYVQIQDFVNISTIFAITILFPLYLVIRLKLNRNIFFILLVIANVFILFIDSYLYRNLFGVLSVALSCGVLSVYGIMKKDWINTLFLVIQIFALLLVLAGAKAGIEDIALMGTMIVLGFNVDVIIKLAGREKEIAKAKLRSAKLENELLKKNINPHFLMNSLNSILVWLRRDPTKAIQLVSELAKEFRIIQQISELKLIPITQEIELCISHLEILNLRKGSNFQLKTEGIEDNELVPPMIFHTLIENGITHGYDGENDGQFIISKQLHNSNTEYRIFNDSQVSKDYPEKTGTGFNYIQARLEESYPNNWDLSFGPVPEGWEVKIIIKGK